MNVLVAGIGNVFLGDDGFGVEVARRLREEPLPTGVRVVDFGIRALHLAFELLDPPDLLLCVDASARGRAPGTVLVLDPDLDRLPVTSPDAHGMDLGAVFAQVRALGGRLPVVRLVTCEPLSIAEGIGLSPPVRDAVAPAVATVRTILDHALSHLAKEVP